ncbi:hypothetical protein OIDMADRAFT_32079 [Oidiodendron maius Zn]|uniref:Endoplasmic reticulum-based factor for assembly of V-ATPase n=1 Tax=Oidiodendron maius (strain Zn) TaxID=913774 RepID=A0A0C3H710_OIDMZ|nr:hypothetical protein OIDMADRAFT_32079 [Oidiodendron maius Zn]
MVFLTISPTILEALEEVQLLDRDTVRNPYKSLELHDERSLLKKDGKYAEVTEHLDGGQEVEGIEDIEISFGEGGSKEQFNEPPLSNPKLGKPISHGQVINLWKELKARGHRPRSLDSLLRGARVYSPPPESKPEPGFQTSEYKALMARLRREAEERSYHRMTNPASPMETFAQRFPLSSAAHAFASSNQPMSSSDLDDDDITYADVNRQVTLIFNVLVSIVACAGAIWVVARWWETPARLALSLGGSLLVGVAEVVVYSGYIRRVSEAKKKEKDIKEVKEVVKTWVVAANDAAGDVGEKSSSIHKGAEDGNFKARRRKRDAS